MRKIFIALFFLVFMASNLYASQAMITESEGYACMGKDRTRKQTKTAAMTDTKRNAIESVKAYVSSATEVKDFALQGDLVSAYANATAEVIKELGKGWYKDPALGDCYRVKIKAEVIPNIKKTGVGTFISKDAPVEIKNQEAFIAAFFDGLRGIAETIASPEKRIVSKKVDKKTHSIVHERIGGFETYSQTTIEDATLKANLIDINYMGKKFVILDFQLIYPDVEFTKFMRWNNPPSTISGVRIEDVTWLEDGTCEVLLSYPYKTK